MRQENAGPIHVIFHDAADFMKRRAKYFRFKTGRKSLKYAYIINARGGKGYSGM